jgi:hypothetical protein
MMIAALILSMLACNMSVVNAGPVPKDDLDDLADNVLAALANQVIANFWADIMTDTDECELEGVGKVYARYFTDEATVQINGVELLPDLKQIIYTFGPSIQGLCEGGDVASWHGVGISDKDSNSFIMLANEFIQDSNGDPKTQNDICQVPPPRVWPRIYLYSRMQKG